MRSDSGRTAIFGRRQQGRVVRRVTRRKDGCIFETSVVEGWEGSIRGDDRDGGGRKFGRYKKVSPEG